MNSCSTVNESAGPAPRNAQSAPGVLWQGNHQNQDSDPENTLVQKYIPLVWTIVNRLATSLPEHVRTEALPETGSRLLAELG